MVIAAHNQFRECEFLRFARFFLNFEGDLDVYVNKFIRFLAMFIVVVAWDGFPGETRSNLKKKKVKKGVWVVISGV